MHNPGYATLMHFAVVLGVPVPYFYCHDDSLAEVLVQLSALGEEDLVALQSWLAKRRT